MNDLHPHYVSPLWWPLALTGYVAAGFLLGAAYSFGRASVPVLGSFLASAFVLLPLASLGIALLYPKPWCAFLGTLIATVGWIYGWLRLGSADPWEVIFQLFALSVSWLLQCIACLLAIQLVEHTRVVGRNRPVNRCLGCGYPLIGLPDPRCPECGRPFTPLVVGARSDAGPGA